MLFGWGIDKMLYKQRVYELSSKDSSTSSQMVMIIEKRNDSDLFKENRKDS